MQMSVLICCHNSRERLKQTLLHLARQDVPIDITWEVVVIDNASTDNTGAFAESTWNELGSPVELRVIIEPIPGICHARRAGLMGTSSSIVVFCDDDNWLNQDYLSTVLTIFYNHPKIGAAGGQSRPSFESGFQPPNWFWSEAKGFAVGRQYNSTGNISGTGFLWGAGLALRAEPLRCMLRLGVRHLLSGRKRHRLLAGDDSETCAWLMLAGYEIYYEDRLLLEHYIPNFRLEELYLLNLKKGFRAANPTISAYRGYIRRKELSDCKRSFTFREIFLVLRNEVVIFLRGWRVKRIVRIIRTNFPSKVRFKPED